jgi:hypothetical protein
VSWKAGKEGVLMPTRHKRPGRELAEHIIRIIEMIDGFGSL